MKYHIWVLVCLLVYLDSSSLVLQGITGTVNTTFSDNPIEGNVTFSILDAGWGFERISKVSGLQFGERVILTSAPLRVPYNGRTYTLTTRIDATKQNDTYNGTKDIFANSYKYTLPFEAHLSS